MGLEEKSRYWEGSQSVGAGESRHPEDIEDGLGATYLSKDAII